MSHVFWVSKKGVKQLLSWLVSLEDCQVGSDQDPAYVISLCRGLNAYFIGRSFFSGSRNSFQPTTILMGHFPMEYDENFSSLFSRWLLSFLFSFSFRNIFEVNLQETYPVGFFISSYAASFAANTMAAIITEVPQFF